MLIGARAQVYEPDVIASFRVSWIGARPPLEPTLVLFMTPLPETIQRTIFLL